MRLRLQPKGSELCGQYCVAMISGEIPEYVIQIFGHNRGTSFIELTFALRKLGLNPDFKLSKAGKKTKLPKLCILSIKYSNTPAQLGTSGHWVVHYKGIIYDPALGKYPIEELESKQGKLTSYLRVKRQ